MLHSTLDARQPSFAAVVADQTPVEATVAELVDDLISEDVTSGDAVVNSGDITTTSGDVVLH